MIITQLDKLIDMDKKKSIDVKIWEISRQLPVFEKDAQGFKFKYVTLDTIVDALIPLLEAANLGYRHSTDAQDCNIVVTTIFELDGQDFRHVSLKIPDDVTLSGMNGYQSLGSALRYFRRYNLITIFDILADTDVDAVLPKATKVPKVDWLKKAKVNIASGKVNRSQMEAWFSKNRGLMSPEVRAEVLVTIQDFNDA